ncbi:nuclear transport factor 2 family protein [Spirosoma sp. KNUC1025]|uniref:nuclear transport factor 2 family protein n=1 Tax=Spirosoma sp. KNUC1025 TaxID=2894082 RepID=UPI00386BD7E1|nr:nuclear transport factor 2 family protein [Spirosoma sp. KNUC1025]
MQHETVNKSIIRDFYRRAVGQGDVAFAEQIIADDYIQHSPAVKPGKAGLLEALGYMKQMPKPTTTTTPFLRLIAEGDYVVTNMSFWWADKQKAVVDVFRFQNGLVAEHWDAMEDQPETTRNGNALMDGAMPIDNADLREQNKETVKNFYERFFISRQVDALSDFVSPDLIQHKSDIANGLNGLRAYLQQQSGQVFIEKVHRIIAEGDFVVVQSEGQLAQKPRMVYDIFRLSNGKIVEQWGVKQMIQ